MYNLTDLKIIILKFNCYKSLDEKKLKEQLINVRDFIAKRYNYTFHKYDLGYYNEDLINNIIRVRYFYYE